MLAKNKMLRLCSAGYIKDEARYIVCLMHLLDGFYAQPPRGFTHIMDGGCGIVTVLFDTETQEVIFIGCGGEG